MGKQAPVTTIPLTKEEEQQVASLKKRGYGVRKEQRGGDTRFIFYRPNHDILIKEARAYVQQRTERDTK